MKQLRWNSFYKTVKKSADESFSVYFLKLIGKMFL